MKRRRNQREHRGRYYSLPAHKAKTLRSRLKSRSRQQATGDYAFAELLYQVHYAQDSASGRPWWSHWGFTSWGDYVEIELHLARRTAEHLVTIWAKFGVELHGKWDANLLLGKSKMRLLCPVVNARNVEKWLRLAAGVPFAALEALVADALAEGSSDPPPISSSLWPFSVKLTLAELEDFDTALGLVRQRGLPTRRKGALLAAVVREWLAVQPKAKAKAREAHPN